MRQGNTSSDQWPIESDRCNQLTPVCCTSEEAARLLEGFRPYLLAIANAEFPRELAPKIAPSDLVQQTLATGHQKFSGFRGTTRKELAHWLRRVLLNFLRSEVRAHSREKRSLARQQAAILSEVPAQDLSLSAKAMSREEREQLQQALQRLPETYRRAIELRHGEDLTFMELGERLGRSEEAARKLWARAVTLLQRELGINGKR